MTHQPFIFTPQCLRFCQSGWLSSESQLAAFGINQNNFSNCPASAGLFFRPVIGTGVQLFGLLPVQEELGGAAPAFTRVNREIVRVRDRDSEQQLQLGFGIRGRGRAFTGLKPEQLFVTGLPVSARRLDFFKKSAAFLPKNAHLYLFFMQ